MKERFRIIVCVDLLLRDQNKILLMMRQNTGSNDGEYELPGGHLEKEEDIVAGIIREAKEELNISLEREELHILHICHHYTEERVNIILEAEKKDHIPMIGEKEKCSELKWVDIDSLPEKTTKKVKTIIENIKQKKIYDFYKSE